MALPEGFALWGVAAVVPFLPDLRFVVKTGLMLMMFGSGIFYHYELILPEHRGFFFLNPMANLIRNYREVLLHQNWPDWQALGVIALLSILFLGLMVWVFHRFSSTYVRVTLES